MKSSLACLRPFPIILLFAVALGLPINQSFQALALSPVQGRDVTTASPIDQGILRINDRVILAKVMAQASGESSPAAQDDALANRDEAKSFPWWTLWLLGLPLLALVIWWVLSKESDHAGTVEAEAIADGALPVLASGRGGEKADPMAAIASPHLLSSLLPSQLVLIPEAGQTVRICWEVSADTKAKSRQQGGERLVLQVYDVTDIDPRQEKPHSVQQFDCDETASELRVTVPLVNRCYLADLGYITRDGQWLRLAHSAPTEVFDGGGVDGAAAAARGSDSLTGMDDPLVMAPVDTPNGQTSSAPVSNPADTNGNSGGLGRAIASPIGSEADQPTLNVFPSEPPIHLWIAASNRGTVHIWWDFPEAIASFLQQQGIQTLDLLLHDVTWIDLDTCPAHHTERVACSLSERDRTVPIWATDRDYLAELGYTDANGQWVRMARSTHISITSL